VSTQIPSDPERETMGDPERETMGLVRPSPNPCWCRARQVTRRMLIEDGVNVNRDEWDSYC
jgi:hypothetical protein